MARIFITGSADGLGKMAASLLVAAGHKVVLHARNTKRAKVAKAGVPGAEAVVTGDFSSIEETIKVAEQVNKLGNFDAVIHNAAIGYQEDSHNLTVDGVEEVFAVNTLAPYILTSLIHRPKRLVYLSSGLHKQGDETMKDLNWEARRWNGSRAYSDSKLYDVMLAFAVARKWPDVYSNAMEPGWVATKMGGPNAPDDLEEGSETQVWLAAGDDPAVNVSGEYFYHKRVISHHPAAKDEEKQEFLLKECERMSGIAFPL
jgi:NAD(P)-dependent dehydrogenase (short-subunit alcohol dehydrogenase family)